MVYIIKSVEVKYFRSGYILRLPLLREVNVISGRNDVGKSNILRALNLFFNGQTEWQRELDFASDFSLHRLGVVRRDTVKGKQFISVEITFNRPKNYSGSLPENFKITRTWNRISPNFSENTNLDRLSSQGMLPSDLNTAKKFLPNFLNRVHYEYVPAVKDRLYFEHLLRRLQKTLLSTRTDADQQIAETASILARYIQEKIVDLSSDFARATNINSTINPPTEFADLFEAFLVSTSEGEEIVPMTLRGDGIQARYVSSVLRYISQKSSDFFIWGFEEPENSLEYSRAIELANDFINIYSEDAQIFVTTHSPAFTSIRTQNSTCYRAYKHDDTTSVVNLWPDVENHDAQQQLIIELGLMRLQEQLHEEYMRQGLALTDARNRVAELEVELENVRQPIVLVAGRTDRLILEQAWSKLDPRRACPFIIREVDTTGDSNDSNAGDAMLRYSIEAWHPADGRKAIAIFDRDHSGVGEFNRLSKNFKQHATIADCVKHSNQLAYALLLPIPPFREEYAAAQNLCMEFMFSDEALLAESPDGRRLQFNEPEVANIQLRNSKKLAEGHLPAIQIPDGYKTPVSGLKYLFASEIVPEIDVRHFQSFRPLFSMFRTLLNEN